MSQDYCCGLETQSYFTRTYMRGFVATRPLYSDVYHRLCLSFMFTFVLSAISWTLPFPHSWNTDVNLDKELFVLFIVS